ERKDSLSADEIAAVNGVLGTDGVFVTRMIAHPRADSHAACDAGTFALETRLLRGSDPEFVQILATTDCVAGGLGAWATSNIESFVTYLLLALFVGYPVVRGWGTIHVRILLPDKTKGFF